MFEDDKKIVFKDAALQQMENSKFFKMIKNLQFLSFMNETKYLKKFF